MSYRYNNINRDDDTLATSLLLAMAVHAIVILGINFSLPDRDKLDNNLPTLDITMVQDQSVQAPENPDYLANANQDGAGDPTQELQQPALLESLPARSVANESVTTPALTAKQSNRKILNSPARPHNKALTGAELIQRSLELASLGDQSVQQTMSDSDRLKHTHISTRTREYIYANYMSSWVAKVERVGNLNYPDAARRKGLSGTLLLDVALQADGSIQEIILLRSSGQKVLDDAAVRIVKLAAPFAPFSPDIRKETDILHITRAWEFLKTHHLQGK